MKKLMSSIAAKTVAYFLIVIAEITGVLSGCGIYIALEKNFYRMPVYRTDNLMESLDYENLMITIFNCKWELIIICILSVIVMISCMIFLICGAGRRKNTEELSKSILTKMPLDLYFICSFTLGSIAVVLSGEFGGILFMGILILVSIPVCLILFTLFISDFKLRIKLGKWWENTLVFFVWNFLWKTGKKIVVFGKEIFLSLPIIWKTAVVVLAIWCIDFFLFLYNVNDPDTYIAYWFFEKIYLLPMILYSALILRKLKRSGEELAAGNLSYYTDTKKMFWDFKDHGENLNNIALGMSKAVEERLKSERFKTELITNVSHDIKTPLTSIINYSDLISKEACENEKIKEYSDALYRQSERLKKLINDLMDASKVSTGNVEVLLSPCEADIFVTQAVGEYEEKLKEHGLELIAKFPTETFQMLADGRHMWRIFDNLMNNVYKYAQNGTRVYLTLEKIDERAVFSLKNTSHYPLDITSEELMERFVRGDRSRHTEGSGLGLSIAKSLTELQNGKFDLTVDGDFFKVVISFGLIETRSHDNAFLISV